MRAMVEPLGAGYEHAWDDMLAGIPGAPRQRVDEVTAFWPMVGQRYAGDLMVVGQATNGWIPTALVDHLLAPEKRRQLIQEARAASANDGDRCRMLWVLDSWAAREGYNSKRSQFWSALNDVVPYLVGDRLDRSAWPSYLAWTNLYKVAPKARNKQVPGPMQRAQMPGTADLLRMELDAYAPQRVLATTGQWIHPFIGPLGLELEWVDSLVLARGTDPSRRSWVVARHPRGQPRVAWVTEVVSSFAALERGPL
jgi:hypothetical protein